MTLNPIPRNAKGGIVVLALILACWGIAKWMGWV